MTEFASIKLRDAQNKCFISQLHRFGKPLGDTVSLLKQKRSRLNKNDLDESGQIYRLALVLKALNVFFGLGLFYRNPGTTACFFTVESERVSRPFILTGKLVCIAFSV